MIMPHEECEQALFGWVEKKRQMGHQLVSASPGITAEEIAFLQDWNLPISINNVSYREGWRFFQLPTGRFCFNLVKNIGKDLRGRDGALISHFIVIDRITMKSTMGDFASMDASLLHGVNSGKELEKLKSKDGDFYPLPRVRFKLRQDFQPEAAYLTSTISREKLTQITYAFMINSFFPDARILLMDGTGEPRAKLIWSVLSLFPLDFRVVPYTTSLFNVKSDIPFVMGVTGYVNAEEFPEYSIISLNENFYRVPRNIEPIRLLAEYLSSMVFSGNVSEIRQYLKYYDSMGADLPASTRLLFSLSKSYVRSNASPEMKLRVVLQASDLEPPKSSYFLEQLHEIVSSGNRNPSYFRIISSFYTESLAASQKNLEKLRSTAGRLMDFILGAGNSPDIFLADLKPLLLRLGTDPFHTVIDEIARKLLSTDIPVEVTVKVLSINDALETGYMDRVYGGTIPRGGQTAFAKIMHSLDPQGKKFWNYMSNLLDDSHGPREINTFFSWAFRDDIVHLLTAEQIAKLFKKIPKKLRKFPEEDYNKLVTEIGNSLLEPPLKSILGRKEIEEIRMMFAEKSVGEGRTSLLRRRQKE